ncbi:11-oxo-beta-amyrin 30-oxidase, partial [Leucoagaricus sp. SymC.cos]
LTLSREGIGCYLAIAPSTVATKSIATARTHSLSQLDDLKGRGAENLGLGVTEPIADLKSTTAFGRGLLWSEGDSHKRQRKAITPAFSNAAIRRLSAVFHDSAHKMKASWDAMFDEAKAQYVMFDVQKCLDAIGIAGFGHDFEALDGKNTPVIEVFDSFDDANTDFFSRIIFFLGPVFPTLQNLPTRSNRTLSRLRETMGKIADELLKRSRQVKDGKDDTVTADKSIIGLLVKSENAGTQLHMSSEEVLAQMNTLLLAGYETTSSMLFGPRLQRSCANIDRRGRLQSVLRRLDKQEKLRQELASLIGGCDPSWEQIMSGFPYLDAVVHEVLRLHPPVTETTRVAAADDVIPFGTPLTTASGSKIDQLFVAKGTIVSSPIAYLNTSETFWGSDSREFVPERWLDERFERASEIQGHRHMLTFSDGPRICLGRTFALAEFKIILAMIVRHYRFELPNGPTTPIVKHPSILPRPKVEGYEGGQVPLKVWRLEAD